MVKSFSRHPVSIISSDENITPVFHAQRLCEKNNRNFAARDPCDPAQKYVEAHGRKSLVLLKPQITKK